MIISIIIFLVAIIAAFGMLLYRAWELRTNRMVIEDETTKFTPELSFRYIETIMLYIIKHVVQWIVLSVVKLWFLIVTKTKIFIQNKWPKVHNLFKKKESPLADGRKISFVERAVIESKIKIKKVKEKIKQDHEEELKVLEEETKEQEEKVDKIL